jgi:GTP-binding nuclear protein Ran
VTFPHTLNQFYSQAQPTVPYFKVALVGERFVGKSTFINRVQTEGFQPFHVRGLFSYRSITGQPVQYLINCFPIGFHGWESVEDDEIAGSQCGIIMFDASKPASGSCKSVASWHDHLTHVCGDIPIVVIGNKIDKRGINNFFENYFQDKGWQYYDVSAQNMVNLEAPFHWLAGQLVNIALITHEAAVKLEEPVLMDVAADANALVALEALADESNNIVVPRLANEPVGSNTVASVAPASLVPVDSLEVNNVVAPFSMKTKVLPKKKKSFSKQKVKPKHGYGLRKRNNGQK